MFREKLEQEFAARRAKNPRHSLRAFATFLGTDHSSLAQILRGSRRAPAVQIRAWARKLGLTQEEAAVYIAAEHVPDAATAHRQHQLRHWTAEALGIALNPLIGRSCVSRARRYSSPTRAGSHGRPASPSIR